MPLSADPAKRRRQLEALQRGAESRAATLKARIEELDQAPRQAPVIEDSIEDRGLVPIEDRGASSNLDRPGGVIVAGSYGELPQAQPEQPEATRDAPDEPSGLPEAPEGPPATEAEEQVPPAGPSTATRAAAALLGVKRTG